MSGQMIFIAYSNEDEGPAKKIRDALRRIDEFKPYIAEDYQTPGENFKERIKSAIESCRYFIVFLTEYGVRSQWVNQELGYACAVKKKLEKNYRIIPISKKAIALKGFITQDSEDLLFLDKFDITVIIANIIRLIRTTIPGGLEEGSLNVKFACYTCKDRGLPHLMIGQIPSHKFIFTAISEGMYVIKYPCDRCGKDVSLDIYTFEQMKY